MPLMAPNKAAGLISRQFDSRWQLSCSSKSRFQTGCADGVPPRRTICDECLSSRGPRRRGGADVDGGDGGISDTSSCFADGSISDTSSCFAGAKCPSSRGRRRSGEVDGEDGEGGVGEISGAIALAPGFGDTGVERQPRGGLGVLTGLGQAELALGVVTGLARAELDIGGLIGGRSQSGRLLLRVRLPPRMLRKVESMS